MLILDTSGYDVGRGGDKKKQKKKKKKTVGFGIFL